MQRLISLFCKQTIFEDHGSATYKYFFTKFNPQSNDTVMHHFNCGLSVVKTLLFYFSQFFTMVLSQFYRYQCIPGIRRVKDIFSDFNYITLNFVIHYLFVHITDSFICLLTINELSILNTVTINYPTGT